jgi:transposase
MRITGGDIVSSTRRRAESPAAACARSKIRGLPPAPKQARSVQATIAEWLEKDPTVTAAIIEQRLRPLGYSGAYTILRDYVRATRPPRKAPRAFLRMEPPPGERFEVDWGHFGALDYAGDKRKLYAFALVEAHSRMLKPLAPCTVSVIKTATSAHSKQRRAVIVGGSLEVVVVRSPRASV